MRCKHCGLPQLSGFVGQGFCRFHWAGQLQHTPGVVPVDMQAAHARAMDHAAQLDRALRAFRSNPTPSLSVSIKRLQGALRHSLKGSES